jgi:hypothetical protein
MVLFFTAFRPLNLLANITGGCTPGAKHQGLIILGFEVLTAQVVKSSVFWDITPCSPLKIKAINPRTVPPPSSGSKNEAGCKLREPASRSSRLYYLLYAGFLIDLPFSPADEGGVFFQETVDFPQTPRHYVSKLELFYNCFSRIYVF